MSRFRSVASRTRAGQRLELADAFRADLIERLVVGSAQFAPRRVGGVVRERSVGVPLKRLRKAGHRAKPSSDSYMPKARRAASTCCSIRLPVSAPVLRDLGEIAGAGPGNQRLAVA